MPGECILKARSATSNDVARRAGVSRAAVSVVLNGARSNIRVSAETRQRILTAASELGYSPDLAAQSLRRGRSRVIGYVRRSFNGVLYEQPVPYHLGASITRAAQNNGYHVIEVSAEGYTFHHRKELLQHLLGYRVDGVIFDWPGSVSDAQQFVDEGLPIVQLIRPQLEVYTSSVTVDSSQGINEAIHHLVSQGHQRIAFLGNGGSHPVDRMRLNNFRRALEHRKVAVCDEYLRLGSVYSLEEGYRFTQDLLSLEIPPTALFVASDIQALGVLRALYQAGVRVPEDLSVISYDDTFAAYLYPPLTSVSQPLEEVAERAVALIIEEIEATHTIQEKVQIVLPTRLTIRASTAPPGAKGS
ncbi:substrate-binding domain-containing protein [Ktedonobacter racemifer]|uniref:substrate-binding domain-containing protein n=1 Tax=Ktedonobacter racemifer TaxID=363277 RepID=UPI000A00F428